MKFRLHIISLLLAVLVVSFAHAETVSQRQAKTIASQFFNAASGQVEPEPKYVWNGRRLTTNSLFPPFYVFNRPAGGFVVISAENKAFPILGYSLIENFNPDKIPASLKALLRMYALQIEAIRYDSRIPEDAISAWGNLSEYINSILTTPYKATDARTALSEAQEGLDALLELPDASGFASAMYTPSQWEQTIDQELDKNGETVLGVIDGDNLRPLIAHGRRGDMYRLETGEPNRALWRLMPTEYLSKGQVALLGNPRQFTETVVEETPHVFYENFVAQTRAEEAERQRQRESNITGVNALVEPQIQWLGGGHYTVSLPEPVAEMRLYSLDGTMVQRDKFRDTQRASVNLTGQPVGFYFAQFITESGVPYTFKIFR